MPGRRGQKGHTSSEDQQGGQMEAQAVVAVGAGGQGGVANSESCWKSY